MLRLTKIEWGIRGIFVIIIVFIVVIAWGVYREVSYCEELMGGVSECIGQIWGRLLKGVDSVQ